MRERFGFPPSTQQKMAPETFQALSVGDLFNGLRLTFVFDTCSSRVPYESIDSGVTLECFGCHQASADPSSWHLHLGDGSEGTDLDPDGLMIILSISEAIEVTNIRDMLGASGKLAAAAELLPEHF